MRTIMLFGMLYIGDAIGHKEIDDSVAGFLAVVIICSIIMDIAEFIKKMIKSNE